MTNAIQTVAASFTNTLPLSTQQCDDVASLQAVLANNLTWCNAQSPSWPATLSPDGNSLTFSNPADYTFTTGGSNVFVPKGFTLTQNVVADPGNLYNPAPVHPANPGAVPTPSAPPPLPAPAGMFTAFVVGQSVDGNYGKVLYTSTNPGLTFAFDGVGSWFAMQDPLPFSDGSDGNYLSRTADYLIGRNRPAYVGGHPINRVAMSGYVRGGSYSADFAQGGALYTPSLNALAAFRAQLGRDPDLIIIGQGEADILTQSIFGWCQNWWSWFLGVRGMGCGSRVVINVETICGLRGSADPPPNTAMNETPDILTARQQGRINIRAAQTSLGSYNANFQIGPNFDQIIQALNRATWDGCHLDAISADAVAQASAQNWCP